MTPATLYREGDDLDELLAELEAEYPEQVRVVAVTHPREGGVFGFFARQRVAVHFELAEADTSIGARSSVPSGAHDDDPLAELIARAEAADTSPRLPDEVTSNAEFAAMLLEVAARKRAAQPHTVQPQTAPAPAPAAAAAPAPAGTPTDITRLDALRELLVGIGVPRALIPDDEPDALTAARRIAHLLPAAPKLPARDGAVLALVGPGTETAHTAALLTESLGIGIDRLWACGVQAAHLPPGARTLTDAWEAATVADEHRRAGYAPVVLVISTDSSQAGSHDSPAVRVLRAAQPDAVWAVVDATRKTVDTRRMLTGLGRIDALAVVGAARTASPASVLHLAAPVALLDGAPASPQRWAAALCEAMAGLES